MAASSCVHSTTANPPCLLEDFTCVAWRDLFTDLCDGYTKTGGGFSHYPAGCSNSSAYRSTFLDKWLEWEIWADRRFDPLGRIRKEKALAQSCLSDTNKELLKLEELENSRQPVGAESHSRQDIELEFWKELNAMVANLEQTCKMEADRRQSLE